MLTFQKSGMSKEGSSCNEMEEETWFTAEQAKEKGLIDGVMFEEKHPIKTNASKFLICLRRKDEPNKKN